MRSLSLCLCLALAACSVRKGALEYDDAKNGLHVQAPGPDWMLEIATDCGADRHACWNALNVKNGASIHVANVTPGTKTPAADMEEIAGELKAAQRENPEKRITVSDPVVSPSGDVARISWNLPGEDGRYQLHAVVMRRSAPDGLIMFLAGSDEKYAVATERDLDVFLERLRAIK